jgi:hypothetical protein
MSDNTTQELRHYARYDAPLRRRALIHRAADEIDYLRARVAELRDLVGCLAGRNNDQIRVMLAGNPDVCDRLIERARAALEAKP